MQEPSGVLVMSIARSAIERQTISLKMWFELVIVAMPRLAVRRS